MLMLFVHPRRGPRHGYCVQWWCVSTCLHNSHVLCYLGQDVRISIISNHALCQAGIHLTTCSRHLCCSDQASVLMDKRSLKPEQKVMELASVFLTAVSKISDVYRDWLTLRASKDNSKGHWEKGLIRSSLPTVVWLPLWRLTLRKHVFSILRVILKMSLLFCLPSALLMVVGRPVIFILAHPLNPCELDSKNHATLQHSMLNGVHPSYLF